MFPTEKMTDNMDLPLPVWKRQVLYEPHFLAQTEGNGGGGGGGRVSMLKWLKHFQKLAPAIRFVT
jgi:hypothetical protein